MRHELNRGLGGALWGRFVGAFQERMQVRGALLERAVRWCPRHALAQPSHAVAVRRSNTAAACAAARGRRGSGAVRVRPPARAPTRQPGSHAPGLRAPAATAAVRTASIYVNVPPPAADHNMQRREPKHTHRVNGAPLCPHCTFAQPAFAQPACMQVAGRTNDAAGDGTTTASVLAREMIHYGLQVRRRSGKGEGKGNAGQGDTR